MSPVKPSTMWFKLHLDSSDSLSLSGVVGKDGCIYWRLVEVGVLCKMNRPYRLHKIRCIVRNIVKGEDVLPEVSLYHSILKRCKLVNTDTVIIILKWWKREMLDKFLFAIQEAKFKTTLQITKGCKFFKSCIAMYPSPEGAAFYEWIASFIQQVQREKIIYKEINVPSTSTANVANQVLNEDSIITEPEDTQDSALAISPFADEMTSNTNDVPHTADEIPSLEVYEMPQTVNEMPRVAAYETVSHAPEIPQRVDQPLPNKPESENDAGSSDKSVVEVDKALFNRLRLLLSTNTNLEFQKNHLEQGLLRMDERLKMLNVEILRVVGLLTKAPDA
nr:uncharacterized protein LOC122273678 [Parasteatoda tepidariorum]